MFGRALTGSEAPGYRWKYSRIRWLYGTKSGTSHVATVLTDVYLPTALDSYGLQH